MRTALLLIVGLALGCGTAESTPDAPAQPAQPAQQAPADQGSRSDISVEDFAPKLAAGAPVIDVRTTGEFARGHVEGAVNLPLGSWTPSDDALQGYRGATLYVICQSGGRSAKAADELAAAGFDAVNVLGGTGAWVRAGKPVVKP